MPPFVLACLAYLSIALPSSTLGLLWPSMRVSFHQSVGALGVLLVFGVTASVLSSAATGRVLPRLGAGRVLASGTFLSGVALAIEAFAPSLWIMTAGTVVFGLGFGAMDSALNAYAASHFGARQINWMHASYGLGATIGPLLTTALLGSGLSWRWIYGSLAVAGVAIAGVFTVTRDHWPESAPPSPPGGTPPRRRDREPGPPGHTADQKPRATALLIAAAFAAVEAGIEAGAGIWGYIFLTAGRGLPHQAAGIVIAAYWATMFAGRAVLGPVAERLGPARVLTGAVIGVALSAALMTVPGPSGLAVAALVTLGLAAAPIFPLFTLTTARRAGAVPRGDTGPRDAAGLSDAGGLTDAGLRRTTRAVSFRVAASAAGNAALPAGMGLAIGAFHAGVLAPALLILSAAMCGLHRAAVRDRTGLRPAGPGRRTRTRRRPRGAAAGRGPHRPGGAAGSVQK